MKAIIESPLGPLLVEADDRGVSRVEFVPDDVKGGEWHPHLDRLREELARYFRGELREFTTPLAPRGTPFQERVWAELCRIRYGETISYTQLAERVGNPAARRAVAQANGANPLCIVVPCHRVIAKDGTLGGYSAGLARKERLLALEGAFFI